MKVRSIVQESSPLCSILIPWLVPHVPGVVIGKLGEGEEFVGGCVAQPRVVYVYVRVIIDNIYGVIEEPERYHGDITRGRPSERDRKVPIWANLCWTAGLKNHEEVRL